MNLLMINYEFPPIGGGGANANYYILKEFAKNKTLIIDLVTSSETSNDYVENFSDNITIHRLNVGKNSLHFWTQREVLRFLYRCSPYVKTLLKRKPYDLCHAFFGFPSGYVAYRFRNEMPYIVSLRGSDVPGFNRRFSWQYVFLKPLFRRIWRGAEEVIANSRELKKLALKTTPDIPVGVVYNGIDTDEFAPSPPSARVKEGFTILTVSRLIPRKCLDYLIRAMPVIIDSCQEVSLVIVGEGSEEESLRKLTIDLGLSAHVNFRGRLEHEDLSDIYKEADLFILPSLWEGMSNTVLEAIASGLPVIVTETGGTEELVGDNGIIVTKESARAIADAVIRLFNDDQLRIHMGKESRETALRFNWTVVARQYLNILKEAAG